VCPQGRDYQGAPGCDAYLRTNLRDKALEMYEGALSLEPEKGAPKEKIERLKDSERN
jgi:hypothetical protein